MTKNENINDKSDDQEYKDKRYYLNQRGKIGRKSEFLKQQRRFERRKRRKEWLTKRISGIKEYTKSFFHPNTLTSVVLAIVLVLGSRKVENELKAQGTKIAEIERVLANEKDNQGIIKETKQFLNNNWPKIVFTIGPLLFKLYLTINKEIAVKKELVETQNNLVETQKNLVETQTEIVVQKEKSELELTEARQKAEQQLAEAQEKAEMELTEAQRNAQAELEAAKKDSLLRIGKLHVTLNRFNRDALLFAERETQMRVKIADCKEELAQAINQRDQLNIELTDCKQLCEQKTQELSESAIKLKSLNAQLNQAEDSQAQLSEQLKKANSEKTFFSRKAYTLQKSLKKIDLERRELVNKVNRSEQEVVGLRVEKEGLESKYQDQVRLKKSVEEKSYELRAENQKQYNQLQKEIDKTNRAVLKMDAADREIQELRMKDVEHTTKNQYLERQLEQEKNIVGQKQLEIGKLDAANEKFEQEIAGIKSELHETVINRDQLESQLKQQKEELIHTSGKEKSNLYKKIKEQEKSISKANQREQKLSKIVKQKGRELTKSYLKEEELIDEVRDLNIKLEKSSTDYFTKLQLERKQQENLYKTSNEVINKMLDRQEISEKQKWYERLQFSLSPQISVGKSKKEEPSQMLVESHFYPSANAYHSPIKIVEERNPKTGESKIIEPKNKKIKKYGN